MDSVGEGEGGKIWENGIETCNIMYEKKINKIIEEKKKRVFSNTTVQKHQFFSAQLSL